MATGFALSPGQVLEDLTPVEAPSENVWSENLARRVMCPDCGEDPPNIIEDWSEGNVVCASCGLVLETHLVDQRSEWRTFASDDAKGDDPSRVGKAEDPNDPTKGALQTAIGFNPAGQRDRNLDRAHTAMYKGEGIQALEVAYNLLRQVCTTLNVPHVTTSRAEELYSSVYQHQAIKKCSMKPLIGACVLMSCRQNANGLGFQDVAAAAGITNREISRAVKQLKLVRRSDLTKDQAASPAELCARYGSMLNLSPKSESLARRIAEHVQAIGTLDGRNPNTTAGACLFMASHLQGETPKTFKDVAKVGGVNDSTIRSAYKKLLDEQTRIVRADWLGEGKGDLARLPPA